MYTNIEFFDEEPIENVAAALNYDFGKIIYFCYPNVIEAKKSSVERFLNDECNIKNVEFVEVPKNNLNDVVNPMREKIKRELDEGNEVFLEITGGESLVLMAAGILSRELDLPIYTCDIENASFIECNEVKGHSVKAAEREEKIKLDLHKYIRMQGGVIDDGFITPSYCRLDKETIEKIFKVSKDNDRCWNAFSMFAGRADSKDNAENDNVICAATKKASKIRRICKAMCN